MPGSEILVASFVGLLVTIASVLSQVELWQRKEYRADRLLAHWREGAWLSSGTEVLVILALVTVGFSSVSVLVGWLATAHVGGWLALLSFAGHHSFRTATRGLFRPDPTAKGLATLVLVGGLTALASFSVLATDMLSAFNWASLITLIPYLTAAVVLMLDAISAYRKGQVIAQARRKRQQLPKLNVVGITGSYGKSSVKHFLSHILREARVPHAATKEHRNAVYPVALDMLEQLRSDTGTYIAELAAYTPGEIKELSELVQPGIGCITAIGNQHVALFGGPAALLKAKWELAEAVPKEGTLVLNGEDKRLRQQAQHYPGQIVWYSTHQAADVQLSEVTYAPRSFTGTLHISERQKPVTVPLAGSGAVSSVAAAAALAHTLNLSLDDIAAALATLSPMPRTMEVRPGVEGSTIIDDSYSANEQGVLAALQHLELFPEQNKVVVLAPLIELGAESSAVHQRIGQALADISAQVIIAGSSYRHELASARDDIHFISSANELVRTVRATIDPGTVVLLEGRVPAILRKSLLSPSDATSHSYITLP